MKSSAQIVANGGWVTRETVGRPRARFFGVLSVSWLSVPPLCALLFGWDLGDGWPESSGPTQWLCLALLGLQPVWIGLALFFRLTESPRPIIEYLPRRR